MLGYADLMARPDSSPDQRARYAGTVRRSGEHVLALLNSALDVARLESGQITLEPRPCDPGQVAREVADLLRPAAAAKSLSLDVVQEGPFPAAVQTDPTRLRQVLINLISNAVKFTSRGSVRIVLRLDQHAARSNPFQPRLAIDVIDTGCGLAPEQLACLFRPFSQALTSGRGHLGGAGLGLFISRQLARALGGDLAVRSESGQGSTFTLELPAGSIAEMPASEPRRAPVPVPIGTPVLSGRVLVADDSPETCRLVAHYLRSAGAEVATAPDGLAAVAEALAARSARRPYDLIVLDVQMPGLDGPSAARRLRDHRCTGRIIALSASGDPDVRDRCLAHGCDGFVLKTADRDAIVAACAACLAARPIAA